MVDMSKDQIEFLYNLHKRLYGAERRHMRVLEKVLLSAMEKLTVEDREQLAKIVLVSEETRNETLDELEADAGNLFKQVQGDGE